MKKKLSSQPKTFRNTLTTAIFLVLLSVLPLQMQAQWSSNPAVNNAISTATGNQEVPTIVSDGSGGAIITWQGDRNSGTSDIYAQRISASGVLQWTTNGVAICTASNSQFDPTIINDGSGGAIITWMDNRSGSNWDIYAQRINASGAVQWTADGVAISTASNTQNNPTIVGDGSGGAIITWMDYKAGGGYSDIYTQRINASGVVQWTTDGVAICTAIGHQQEPAIIADGSGGAIIAWWEFRSGGDIYAQRISASGTTQWTTDGVAISKDTNSQGPPIIVSDGSGGAIITWMDSRNGSNYDIYAQHINASGAVQWTNNGVAICSETTPQYYPTIVSDGSGRAIITWQDYRNGIYSDIYAQCINASGAVQWTADGVAICLATNPQEKPKIVSDGSGGAIITWEDARPASNMDIYAQRINASGAVQWTTNGVAISTALESQFNPTIVSDGSGGAIITWEDYYRSSSDLDIYAQNIKADGTLGTPASEINLIIKEIKCSPNPFNHSFKLDYHSSSDEQASVLIYGMTGNLLENLSLNGFNNEIDLGANLSNGIYSISFIQGDKARFFRMIKVD